MDDAAQHIAAMNPAQLRTWLRYHWSLLGETLVRPGVIKVGDIRSKHALQMGFIDDEQVIQAFLPY